MQRLSKADSLESVELAKRCEASVLILGETGTGKSTLAREIHSGSLRSMGPFISVNLASLHESTIESTLFGHERGAFTGADRARMGRLEMANGGTVFLDEIGELSLPLQARLLEFLQNRTLTPLGSNRERKINVRIICATNRNLEKEVVAGKFREDLLHRIRVLALDLPALADLSDEAFSEEVHSMLDRACEISGRKLLRISKEVAEILECYSWPGNFRELENVIEISTLKGSGPVFEFDDLPKWLVDKVRSAPVYQLNSMVRLERQGKRSSGLASAEVPIEKSYFNTMQRFEKAILEFYISEYPGGLAMAARQVGLSKATFYRKAERYGLLTQKGSNVMQRSEA